MSSLLDQLLDVTDDELESWDTTARTWYRQTLERELSLRSPADFAVTHSGGLWQPFPHLRYTSDAIVGMVEHDECDLLLVDEPVRHGKSELCSKWTPAWYHAKYEGRRRVGISSYEADFARGWNRRVRDIINEVGHHYGLEKQKDVWAQDNWELTAGGGQWSAGAGGPITGKGGHLLICDDPIKNKKEADSPTFRNDLWEWWDMTWTTRRMGPGTKYLLIMSRWHVDDVMGRILKVQDSYGLRIRRLHLPALAEDDDELGRRPGEALCPDMYDEAALHAIRKTSPIGFPALYQQRPVPAGGGLFKTDNLNQYHRLEGDENYLLLNDQRVRLDECMIFATMDTAYTKSKTSDYTAIAVWAVPPQTDEEPTNLILLDMIRQRISADTGSRHAPIIERVWNSWKRMRWVGLEKIVASYSLFHEAQRSGVVMKWLEPDRNKVARAETAVALTEQGRLWLPREAEWLDDYIEELTTFPAGEHDDQVDVTSYAAEQLVKRQVRGRRHKKQPETFDEQVWAKVQKMNKRHARDPILGSWHGG